MLNTAQKVTSIEGYRPQPTANAAELIASKLEEISNNAAALRRRRSVFQEATSRYAKASGTTIEQALMDNQGRPSPSRGYTIAEAANQMDAYGNRMVGNRQRIRESLADLAELPAAALQEVTDEFQGMTLQGTIGDLADTFDSFGRNLSDWMKTLFSAMRFTLPDLGRLADIALPPAPVSTVDYVVDTAIAA
ncbi:hypothetical protein HY374_01670 [Candidatus Berkelbacteria bacterium]|nr:hypothetical protein [Candidatus Berkelbacteria bacterium]